MVNISKASIAGAIAALSISTFAAAQPANEIDFGDDSSDWSGDGECDDARFEGSGVATSLITENIGKDASDCTAAVADGTASMRSLYSGPANGDPIDFGDNTSEYADNQVCDDIRFTGEYASEVVYVVTDIGHDANDCRAAFESGVARWQGDTIPPTGGIDIDALMAQ